MPSTGRLCLLCASAIECGDAVQRDRASPTRLWRVYTNPVTRKVQEDRVCPTLVIACIAARYPKLVIAELYPPGWESAHSLA
jgi:hypothetical protein